jgi:hypothetical protein
MRDKTNPPTNPLTIPPYSCLYPLREMRLEAITAAPARMTIHDNIMRETSKYEKITQPSPNPIRNPPKPNPDDLLMESPVSNSIH